MNASEFRQLTQALGDLHSVREFFCKIGRPRWEIDQLIEELQELRENAFDEAAG